MWVLWECESQQPLIILDKKLLAGVFALIVFKGIPERLLPFLFTEIWGKQAGQ